MPADDSAPAVARAIQEERDCAADLYNAACSLMRHQSDRDCWHNLQNAAARWNAAAQYARNQTIRCECIARSGVPPHADP